jgi:hypothetical protein
MRTKSKWFAKGKSRSPEQLATVAAMTLWRLGIQTIRSMRKADYDIEAGPQFFAFLGEYLVFLAHLADRFVYTHIEPEARVEFMTTLVGRLGDMLAENARDLVGADYAETKKVFVDHFNRRGEDYAHFSSDESGPEYGFLRYCGNQLMEILPEKDRVWVVEQVVSIEAPEAVKTLRTAFDNLFATAAPVQPAGQP